MKIPTTKNLSTAVATLAATVVLSACSEPSQRVTVFDFAEEARWLDDDSSAAEYLAGDNALRLMRGDGATFYAEIPNDAALEIDSIGSTRQSGRLLLTVETEGIAILQEQLPVGSTKLRISLQERPGFSKITFLASDFDSGRILEISEPRITATRPPQTPTPNSVIETASFEDERKPHIFIYLSDTLRADRLGPWGGDPELTPNLNRFAASATVALDAVNQSPWTRASVGSLFTGIEPHRNGVATRDSSLADEAVTMAEYLGSLGYDTAGLVTNGNAGEKYGLHQGFDYYWRPGGQWKSDFMVVDAMSDFLDNRQDAERPLFAYLHMLDPHAPYRPASEDIERLAATEVDPARGELDFLKQYRNRKNEPVPPAVAEDITRLYDAEVSGTDRVFAAFLELLKKHDLFDNSIIIFLADHGEAFWEHETWGHGHTLHHELLAMPFIIRMPGQSEGATLDRVVQHIDVLPSLLSVLGAGLPNFLSGNSFFEVPQEEAEAFSALDLDGRRAWSLTTPEWKLLQEVNRSGRDRPPLLYDRIRDRDEAQNIASQRPLVVGALMHRLNRTRRAAIVFGPGRAPDIDAALESELRALGYL